MKKIYFLIFQLVVVAGYAQQASRNINLNAKQLAGGVNISWATLAESNMQRHVIEKSTDGRNYTTAGTLTAINNNANNQYNFRDATPVSGINYYRLRSENGTGAIAYSDIVMVDNSYTKTDIQVYPNPVYGGRVQLQMKNIPAGKYAVVIYNVSGQQLYNQSMTLSEGSTTQFINLPTSVGKGNYVLHVTNGQSRVNKNLVVN